MAARVRSPAAAPAPARALATPAFARAAVAAAPAAPAVSAPADCCIYAGTGSGYAIGNMVLPNFGGSVTPTLTAGFIAGDGASFVTVLVNSSDTATSAAGWIIAGNETGQTMTLWNVDATGSPTCDSVFLPYPGEYIASFKLCTGAGGLWQSYVSTYRLGSMSMDSYAQNAGLLATLTAPNAGCALATIYGTATPLGNGAWSFNAVDGAAVAVPATYGVPPAYCPEPTLSA